MNPEPNAQNVPAQPVVPGLSPGAHAPTIVPPTPAFPWRRWLPVLILAAVMLVGFGAGAHKLLMLDTIFDARDRYRAVIADHTALALTTFFLAYVVVVALSVPGATLLTLVGGLVFGWLLGGFASVMAATLGAAIVFLVAKTAIGENLARKAGPQVARLQSGFRENALSYMLFLRLVPAFPFFIVNIVPAVLGVPFRTFIVGTWFGILPGSFAYSFIGAGLDHAVAAARVKQAACRAADAAAHCSLKFDLSSLLSMEFKVALGLLGLLALIPVLIKTWKGRHARAHT